MTERQLPGVLHSDLDDLVLIIPFAEGYSLYL